MDVGEAEGIDEAARRRRRLVGLVVVTGRQLQRWSWSWVEGSGSRHDEHA